MSPLSSFSQPADTSVQYADIDGGRIAYREKNAHQNKLLFFIHGNSSNGTFFQTVLDDERFSPYHLVTVDLPGHGNSDPLRGEDYSFPHLAKRLSSLLTSKWPGKYYALVAISLGTNLVAEMLPFLSAPAGIVLLSPKVFGSRASMESMINSATDTSFMVSDDHTKEELPSLFKQGVHKQTAAILEQLVEAHRGTAAGFRPGYLQSVLRGEFSDQVETLVKTNLPILILFGKEDPVTNLHYLDQSGLSFWRGAPQLLEDCGYFIALEAPEAMKKSMLDYLEERFEAFTGNHAC